MVRIRYSSARKLLALAILSCGMFPVTSRADDVYIGNDALWTDPTAWSTGSVPAPTDMVIVLPAVGANQTHTLTVNTANSVSGLVLGTTGDGTLNLALDGGSITTTVQGISILAGAQVTGAGGLSTTTAPISNAGIINANLSNASLTIATATGTSSMNAGIMQATNGGNLTLSFASPFDNTAGIISATGSSNGAASRVNITATNATGGQYTTDAVGQLFFTGGNFTHPSISGNIFLSGTTAFQSPTFAGNITIPSTFPTTTVALSGTITNNANITIGGLVNINDSAIFNGNGTIFLNSGFSFNSGNITSSTSIGALLTIGAQQTVTGGGSIGAHNTVINHGLFIAKPNVSWLDATIAVNDGTIEAVGGGAVILELPTVSDSLDNANGTIAAIDSLPNMPSVVTIDTPVNGGQLITDALGQLHVEYALSNLTASGNIDITANCTLSDVTLAGNVKTSAMSNVTLSGSIVNNANYSIGLSNMTVAGQVALSGTGTFTMSNCTIGGIFGSASLIIGSTQTLVGSGTMGKGFQWTNAGTINANSPASLALFVGVSVEPLSTNTGLLEATSGGTLRLNGNSTFDTLNNINGTIAALGASSNGTPSNVTIANLTILDGQLNTDATGQIHLQYVSLNNTALSGNFFFDLLGNVSLQDVTVSGTVTQSVPVTLSGTIINNAAWTSNLIGAFTLPTSVSLLGTGSLHLRSTTFSATTTSAALTIGANQTIVGTATFSPALSLIVINNGTINANDPLGFFFTVSSGASNNGTLEATAGGNLSLSGTSIANTLDNTGGLISASGSANGTASFIALNKVTIQDGQVITDSTDQIRITGAAAIYKASISGNLLVTAGNALSLGGDTLTGTITQAANSTVNLIGNLTNIFVNNASWSQAGPANISITAAIDLNGTGSIALANGSISIDGELILGPNQNLHGSGIIGMFDAFTNNGLINANLAGATLQISSGANSPGVFFTNAGILSATNGSTLQLSTGTAASIDNSLGSIQALGAASGGSPASTVLISKTALAGGQISSDALGHIQLANASLTGTALSGNIFITANSTLTSTTLAGSVIQSAGVTTTLAGNIVNNAAWSQLGAATINVPGTAALNGNGTLTLNAGSITGGVLSIGPAQTLQGSGNISLAVINAGTIYASTAPNLTLTSTLINTGTLDIAANTTLSVNGGLHGSLNLIGPGTLRLNTTNNSLSSITGNGTLIVGTGTPAVSRLVTGPIHLANLTLLGFTQIIPNSGPSLLGNISINAFFSGALDLTNNPLLVEPAPSSKAALFHALKSNLITGASHSTGLFATGLPADTGLAIVDNAALPLPFTTYDGIPIDTNALLVVPALLGDTDLSNTVDMNDLNTILNHLGVADSNWTDGNFDNAATIDLTDLNDVLNNLGLTFANPTQLPITNYQLPVSPTSAPEPASLLMLGASALLLSARRRSIRRVVSH